MIINKVVSFLAIADNDSPAFEKPQKWRKYIGIQETENGEEFA